ncbi:hypothetical protein HanRHA438_Chr13g0620831 [Helianthus annuus]|nr:hypothetical protein HanRHA438_Chr13g0620831 [Helianthus annuus]
MIDFRFGQPLICTYSSMLLSLLLLLFIFCPPHSVSDSLLQYKMLSDLSFCPPVGKEIVVIELQATTPNVSTLSGQIQRFILSQ